MKHKTSGLEGNALDCAVAIAEGEAISTLDCMPIFYQVKGYSTEWRHGGQIIERERICIGLDNPKGTAWFAAADAWLSHDLVIHGRYYISATPLIAAMRAYVASKLGEEVELP